MGSGRRDGGETPAVLDLLVVDDDHRVRRVVRRGLEPEGFRVTEAADGTTALAALAHSHPDVVILDLYMPDISGLDVLRELRRNDTDAHVIMLTGAGGELDRVDGLAAGADDYVVKPFSVRELAARVGAVRRRRQVDGPDVVEAGGLHLERRERRATLDGKVLDLTRREFDLLHHLASHPGETFRREALLEAVWGSSVEWQSPATVTEHVRRLRQKVEADPEHPELVLTVRGAGYRFAAHREATSDADPVATWAVDASSDPTLVVVEGIVMHATAEALALLGAIDPAQVVGRPVFEFIGTGSLSDALASFEAIERGRATRPERTQARRVDGREVPVEWMAMSVVLEGRRARQLTFWEVADDTSTAQEFAFGIGADAADAVIITDAEYRIQRFNSAAESLFGWREHEVLGRLVTEVVPGVLDGEEREAMRAQYAAAGRWHGEIVQRRRDGTEVRTWTTVTLLQDTGGRTLGAAVVSRVHATGSQGSDAARIPHLASQLQRAIGDGELVVHYQPIIRLHANDVGGLEALVRWAHPERGLLGPDAFVPAAERSGMIRQVGAAVLEQVCAQWSAWNSEGHDITVAVNISGSEVSDPGLAARIRDALQLASMPSDRLWLEVTETSLVHDTAGATRALDEIAEMGVRTAIDDFGTGWASLTYLRQFPVHALKIDRTFIAGIVASSTDAAIVRSILRLATDLRLDVVAEGIEDEHQLTALRALGCELGQGYLLGRPAAATDLGPELR